MARIRTPGSAELPPPTQGPEGTTLATLLRARRFRLGAGTERVASHLALFGGEVAGDAAPWVGQARPPADAPTIALGDYPGTLGPKSFGFLNNEGKVAALDAPLPSLPRPGSLALVVPTRDELPDIVPLVLGRGFGLSWLISVGNGNPAEAIAFLSADPATSSLALVLGHGAEGASLRQTLGAKPAVVLGGDSICRAVARRAGAHVAGSLDEWLSRATLLDAGVEPGAEVSIVVVGGGRAFVELELERAGLSAPVASVDDRDRDALSSALEGASRSGRPVLLLAGGPPPQTSELPTPLDAVREVAGALPNLKVIPADLRHPEQLRALLSALATAPVEDRASSRMRIDRALAERVREEVERDLSDHDAKRLLKAYGARVTRQAPTATPTGALKLARAIGLPVLLAAGPDGVEERVAESLPDVRRLAALLLQEATDTNTPTLMVRERFPEVPRVRLKVQPEKGLGLTLRVGDGCALLPLTRPDALALAGGTAARRAQDQRALADLLVQISACAVAEEALFELELYVGAEPAVLKAHGSLKNREGR